MEVSECIRARYEENLSLSCFLAVDVTLSKSRSWFHIQYMKITSSLLSESYCGVCLLLQKFFRFGVPLRLLCTVIMCSVSACNVPLNCV